MFFNPLRVFETSKVWPDLHFQIHHIPFKTHLLVKIPGRLIDPPDAELQAVDALLPAEFADVMDQLFTDPFVLVFRHDGHLVDLHQLVTIRVERADTGVLFMKGQSIACRDFVQIGHYAINVILRQQSFVPGQELLIIVRRENVRVFLVVKGMDVAVQASEQFRVIFQVELEVWGAWNGVLHGSDDFFMIFSILVVLPFILIIR